MPKVTAGRWAWGLLVYGKPFPAESTMAWVEEELKEMQTESAFPETTDSSEAKPADRAETETKTEAGKETQAAPQANGRIETDLAHSTPAQSQTETELKAQPSVIAIDDSDSDLSEPAPPAEPKPQPGSRAERFVQEQTERWQTVNWPYCEPRLSHPSTDLG